jgi:alanine racemase
MITLPSEHTKWTHIHLGALRHNVRHLKAAAPGAHLMGVVKANAYGHNIEIIGPALAAQGVKHFGVATLAEALSLKNLLAYAPPHMILILGAMPTHQYARAMREGLHFMLHTPSDVSLIAQLARHQEQKAYVHLKIDTGMGRIGFLPEDLGSVLNACLRHREQIEVAGVCSHLATADDPDPRHARLQIETFARCRQQCLEHPLFLQRKPLFHLANSDGILNYPESHHDMIRPGIALYGYTGVASEQQYLRPVLSLHSQIVQRRKVPTGHPIGYGKTFITQRPSELALISIGYEDGVPRQLSNQFQMQVEHHILPVIGRVSMDQCVLDLTHLASLSQELPRVGDSVTLLSEDLPAYIWAERLDTIPYEILTSLGQRLPRIPIPADPSP